MTWHKKRYQVFSMQHYYPAGGMDDLEAVTDSLDAAKEYAEQNAESTASYEIYDTHTGEQHHIHDGKWEIFVPTDVYNIDEKVIEGNVITHVEGIPKDLPPGQYTCTIKSVHVNTNHDVRVIAQFNDEQVRGEGETK